MSIKHINNATAIQLHSSTVDSCGVTVVKNKTGTKELILPVLGEKQWIKTIHMKIAQLSFPRRSPRYYCNGNGLHFRLVNQLRDYFSYSLHLQTDVWHISNFLSVSVSAHVSFLIYIIILIMLNSNVILHLTSGTLHVQSDFYNEWTSHRSFYTCYKIHNVVKYNR